MGTKTSEKKSSRFEVEIRHNLEQFLHSMEEPLKSLEISGYGGSDAKFYSDIKVSNPHNGKNVWIEVKENKYACFAGPSMKYRDGKWECTTIDEYDPLSKFYVDAITDGANKFISFCRSYLKRDDINIPKDLTPQLINAWKDSGSVEDTENDVQFITDKIQLEDFGEKVSEYYKTSKNEPVYYMQVGDELYIVDKNYNPLGLKTRDGKDLKTVSEAFRLGRIQFRAKGIDKKLKDGGKYYYSIVCDVKILADDEKKDDGYACSLKSENKFPVIDGRMGERRIDLNESTGFFRRGVEVILEGIVNGCQSCQTNEFGERIAKTLPHNDFVFETVNNIVRDCQADPDERNDDYMFLRGINLMEGGYFIASITGGKNGGNNKRRILTYFSVVKKVAKRLIEQFGNVWLVDWVNDCPDDVWDVRLGFRDEKNAAQYEYMAEIEQAIDILDKKDGEIGGKKSDFKTDGIKIWIDDIREAPVGFKWIKSVNEFIDYCCEYGIDDVGLFDTDHDAGDYQKDGGDYSRCFDYLEANGCQDIIVHIHSANPVGANNIRRIITKNKDMGWKEIRNS